MKWSTHEVASYMLNTNILSTKRVRGRHVSTCTLNMVRTYSAYLLYTMTMIMKNYSDMFVHFQYTISLLYSLFLALAV